MSAMDYEVGSIIKVERAMKNGMKWSTWKVTIRHRLVPACAICGNRLYFFSTMTKDDPKRIRRQRTHTCKLELTEARLQDLQEKGETVIGFPTEHTFKVTVIRVPILKVDNKEVK